MEKKDTRKSILQMARGAIMESVDREMNTVIDNIIDENTNPAAKRKLTVTLEFSPDDNREVVSVIASVKTTLCSANSVTTALYISKAKKGSAEAFEMVPNIPGQSNLFNGEEDEYPVLKLVGM